MNVRKESAVTLSQAAERARFAVRFDPEGSVRLEPGAGGIDGALGRLVAIVAAAMVDGTWSRLKACQADRCGWAFYDHARNRSRRWCSMAVCGNRTKARSYRRRHAA
jgi:predicted RNA-binding Zn ribbon-like protein